MKRGFKAEAERLASRLRDQLGTSSTTPVDILQLAEQQRVTVLSATDLIDETRLREIESLQPGAFSAATFHLPDNTITAVYNPLNDPVRTTSDIAHELAHVLLKHDVRELQQLAGHTFFTCNPEQEEEANWLAGCLLLPRDLLLREARAGSTPELIASRHHVSVVMARFRLNASGVQLQVRRSRQRRFS
jgi:Zn-dependent peptidase ImmA (M78 family)